ncbi:hypothetical protein BH11ARM1_BH11ARM1_07560 [soil metagenome]
MKISRRTTLQMGASLALSTQLPLQLNDQKAMKFSQKYAPHFGMFQNSAGSDLVDQLKFATDQGFTAWEDNGMGQRSPEEQEKLAKAMSSLGMEFGVFVLNISSAWAPNMSTGKPEFVETFLKECHAAVDVAKRTNAKWTTVVPGMLDERLEMGYQTAHVVDALRKGVEILEPHGVVMVLEALNPRRDHPGMFLSKIAQAYEICRAVNSPSCKILFDLYHQQITEGNLIPNIDLAWSEIAYFQIGDNPGRNEPLTGEINYRNIFGHVAAKGYTGVLGMEHGNSKPGKEGEMAVIQAYRRSDPR